MTDPITIIRKRIQDAREMNKQVDPSIREVDRLLSDLEKATTAIESSIKTLGECEQRPLVEAQLFYLRQTLAEIAGET